MRRATNLLWCEMLHDVQAVIHTSAHDELGCPSITFRLTKPDYNRFRKILYTVRPLQQY